MPSRREVAKLMDDMERKSWPVFHTDPNERTAGCVGLGQGALLVNGQPVGFLQKEVTLTREGKEEKIKLAIDLHSKGVITMEEARRMMGPPAVPAMRPRIDPDRDGDVILPRAFSKRPRPRLPKLRLPFKMPFCAIVGSATAWAGTAPVYAWQIPLGYVLGGLCVLLLGIRGDLRSDADAPQREDGFSQ